MAGLLSKQRLPRRVGFRRRDATGAVGSAYVLLPAPRSLKSTGKLKNPAELWKPPATKANQSMGGPAFLGNDLGSTSYIQHFADFVQPSPIECMKLTPMLPEFYCRATQSLRRDFLQFEQVFI
jgi:hypothetical protein